MQLELRQPGLEPNGDILGGIRVLHSLPLRRARLQQRANRAACFVLAKFQSAPAHPSEYGDRTSPVKWNPVYTILPIGARLWFEFNDGGVGSI